MKKFHISPDGEPKVCTATLKCPYGQDIKNHFESSESARSHFENVMEVPVKKSSIEVETLQKLKNDLIEILVTVNDSGNKIAIGEKELQYIDETVNLEISEGNSKEIAELAAYYTEGEDEYEDGLIVVKTVAHQPLGGKLKEHYANIFEYNGEKYILDLAFSEVNPNVDYPYVDKLDNWKKEIDRVSILGREEFIPPSPDPRAGEISKVNPGEFNPLLETATLDTLQKNNKDSFTQFLKVGEVKVASAKYKLEDGKPKLMSIETRSEYRNQGYMKKLLNEIAKEYNVEKVSSSSSFTAQGYNYTRHLTEPKSGDEPKINFPEFTGDRPFSFVVDWIEGITYD